MQLLCNVAKLAPEFVDRLILNGILLGNVLESPAEIAAVDYFGPVDAQRGIDRRLDVLGPDVAPGGETGVDDGVAQVVGLADRAPSPDAGSGEHRRLLRMMVATVVLVEWADRAAELAHGHDERRIEASVVLQVRDQSTQARVELPGQELEIR